jgi:hypothetical protein
MLTAAALAAATMTCASAQDAPPTLDPGVYSSRVGPPDLIQVRLHAYTCVARSRVAVGYWTAATRTLARAGALRQCAVRTPFGMACLVTGCT